MMFTYDMCHSRDLCWKRIFYFRLLSAFRKCGVCISYDKCVCAWPRSWDCVGWKRLEYCHLSPTVSISSVGRGVLCFSPIIACRGDQMHRQHPVKSSWETSSGIFRPSRKLWPHGANLCFLLLVVSPSEFFLVFIPRHHATLAG